MCCMSCTKVPIIRLVALAVLAVGLAACLIGLVSPFWALYEPGLPRSAPFASTELETEDAGELEPLPGPSTTREPVRRAESEGLWGRCDAFNYSLCVWFWQDNFHLENIFPVWHKASQVLFMAGYAVLVCAFVIACLHVCCGCCKSVCLPTVVSVIVTVAVLAIVSSITVYGALAYKERGIRLVGLGSASKDTADDADASETASDGQQLSAAAHLDWAYYVSVGGSAVALLAAAIFFCDGRRAMAAAEDGRSDREGYEAAATMEI